MHPGSEPPTGDRGGKGPKKGRGEDLLCLTPSLVELAGAKES